jgi:hypothetical protein
MTYYCIVRCFHCSKEKKQVEVDIYSSTTLEGAKYMLRQEENDRLGEDAVDAHIDFPALTVGNTQGYPGEIHDCNKNGEIDIKPYTVTYKVFLVTLD